MAIALFNRKSTVTRTTSKGYINDDEEYVSGSSSEITIDCNIQPFREGVNNFNSDTGYRTISSIKVYSQQKLVATDDTSKIVGDQLTYEGIEYFCKNLERWDGQTSAGTSLIPEHWLGYFHKKDVS
jgi:hypothetical protein